MQKMLRTILRGGKLNARLMQTLRSLRRPLLSLLARPLEATLMTKKCLWCNKRNSRLANGGIGGYCDKCFETDYPEGIRNVRLHISRHNEFVRRNV